MICHAALRTRPGAVLMLLIFSLAVVGLLIVGVARMFAARHELQIAQERHVQAALLAQAGVERGAALWAADAAATGETWTIPAEQLSGKQPAQVNITIGVVEGSPAERTITAKAALGGEPSGAIKYTRSAHIAAASP